MKMKEVKKIILVIGILAGSIILGVVLLMAVYMIPNKRMVGHVRESTELLQQEFADSNIITGYQFTLTGLFTDSIIIQNAIYNEGEHSLLERALNVYRQDVSEESWAPGYSLLSYINGEILIEVSYARYWHGYLVLLKPLLYFFDIGELRLLGVLLFGVLCLAIIWGFYQRKKMAQGMALTVTLIWMMPLSMMMSLSLSVCFFIMVFGVLIQLVWHDKLMADRYLYFFLIMGIITAYFDLLTYPLVSLGIPLTVWMTLQKFKSKKCMKAILVNIVSWITGYVGMWAAKWVVSDLLLGTSVIPDALNTVFQRTGNAESQSRLSSFADTLNYNFSVYNNWPYFFMTIIMILVMLYIIWRQYKHIVINSIDVICYGMIMLLPFIWFFMATNHSIEHWMFTFRILGVTIFSVLCLFLECVTVKSGEVYE